MSGTSSWTLGFGLGLLAPLLACGRRGVQTADVVMTWSIDGEDSASRCEAHGAARIEIEITESSGRHVDTLWHRCFAAHAIDILDRSYLAEGVEVTLPVGHDFLASARLTDDNGSPITTSVTATLSPAAYGSAPEPHFEFNGTFTNGTRSRSNGESVVPERAR